jgi:hypothetical protein
MTMLKEYLIRCAQELDALGRYATADIIDGLANEEQFPILYHGTKDDYEPSQVQVNKRMQGLYLTTSEEAASKYGEVRAYRPNPDVKILDLSYEGADLWEWMREHDILDEEDLENEDLHNYVLNGQIFQYDISSNTHYADYIVRTAKSLGYDIVKISDWLGHGDNIAWIATNDNAIAHVQ